MAWYDEAVFYHIYPLGMCGCKKINDGTPENHFDKLNEWTEHIKKIGCNAIYIGPLFESVGHGYETTDYKKVDCRLGTNEDFKNYVKNCHEKGIKVIVDGVFNHVGREFFAFKDLKEKRENSPYKDWFCNVNFWNNNEYNDGFSYDNWGGYNLLVKLNQTNGDVQRFIYDVIDFWIREFDIDGIRLDAADVLNHDFMAGIRHSIESKKPDFWLMGEVIHGQYSNWVNGGKLHSVTNYELHKALYSGHNDHNYFEIAHTVQRSLQINGDIRLYNFVDNHDVARIYSKLNNKEHLFPIHLLLYGLPGVPSIYYGSEFSIEGNKERGSDDSLRPSLELFDFQNYYSDNKITKLITRLGEIKQKYKELSYGRYEQLVLTNRQYAFGRIMDNSAAIIVVNNDDNPTEMWIKLPFLKKNVVNLLEKPFGEKKFRIENGQLVVSLDACDGTIILVTDEEVKVESENSVEAEIEKNIEADKANESSEAEKIIEADKENEISEDKKVIETENNSLSEDSALVGLENKNKIVSEDEKGYIASERLTRQMAFALELDKEKFIGRQTYLSDSSRKENDAEHAWHLALMTMLLSEYSNEKIDVLRTMAMVILHDVVEIDAGDTFAYDTKAQTTKRARELAAAERIFDILPEDQKKKFRGLWDEFEENNTAEAKFAHAMDSVQPIMLNNATIGKAWREHDVAADSVRERAEKKVRPGSEELYRLVSSYIDKNQKEGNLK